ncbi:MAG: hypothetical protein L6365_01170 [Desulfobulbaceae bacterium]|nr:hypothetical protein [Pseudomonadota bacterium]MCG2746126.1 hypothetical protein [Desulfobulbaceae bacterium]
MEKRGPKNKLFRFLNAEFLMFPRKVPALNFPDDKSGTYHALYGCPEGLSRQSILDGFLLMPIQAEKTFFLPLSTQRSQRNILYHSQLALWDLRFLWLIFSFYKSIYTGSRKINMTASQQIKTNQ